MGQSHWDELIRMEGRIRKQRQETLYRQRERRRKFVEVLCIILLLTMVGAFLVFLAWLYVKRRENG